MPALRDLMIDLAIMAFIAVVLALLGPFGMFAVPLPIRILYWLVIGVSGFLFYRPAMRLASRAALRLALPEPAMWAAACVAATVPMTALVLFANGLIGSRDPLDIADAADMFCNVLITAGVVCIIFWFASRRQREADAADAPSPMPAPLVTPVAEPAPAPAPFLDRLPPQIGRDLIALEMEDHYVRAHTASGSALILIRLRDAVAELGPVDGAQVHRSWWVARDAVDRVFRDGRNVQLALRGGLIAPVARNAVGDLKVRGWF